MIKKARLNNKAHYMIIKFVPKARSLFRKKVFPLSKIPMMFYASKNIESSVKEEAGSVENIVRSFRGILL